MQLHSVTAQQTHVTTIVISASATNEHVQQLINNCKQKFNVATTFSDFCDEGHVLTLQSTKANLKACITHLNVQAKIEALQ